jgi:hypothetical protein
MFLAEHPAPRPFVKQYALLIAVRGIETAAIKESLDLKIGMDIVSAKKMINPSR